MPHLPLEHEDEKDEQTVHNVQGVSEIPDERIFLDNAGEHLQQPHAAHDDEQLHVHHVHGAIGEEFALDAIGGLFVVLCLHAMDLALYLAAVARGEGEQHGVDDDVHADGQQEKDHVHVGEVVFIIGWGGSESKGIN